MAYNPDPVPREIIEAGCKAGMSFGEVAEAGNWSRSKVVRAARKFGIKSGRRSGLRAGSKPQRCSCGETDPAAFVQVGSRNRAHLSMCKRCYREKYRRINQEKKRRIVEFLGGCCGRCGYDRSLRALHVHHRDPSQKDPTWKQLRYRTFEAVREELSKCELLCANCHAEEHDELERDGRWWQAA